MTRRVAAHAALAFLAAGMLTALVVIDVISQLAHPILTGAIEAPLDDA